jgi:hypothetical protein
MSTRDDWYRKTSWSKSDAAEFELRLSKSRGQRTQYLSMQAGHLAGTGKARLAAPAIALANRYLEEAPGGFFEVSALLSIANANATLGNTSDALKAYRAAVKVESSKRTIRCLANLQYAWYAVSNGVAAEYNEVLEAMESMEDSDLVFPLHQYKFFASLALIAKERSDDQYARRMARNALEAEARAAPFARHKDVGIVKNIEPFIQEQIRQLAS